MTRTKMHISNVKLPFYPPCEVKCGLQNSDVNNFILLYTGLVTILSWHTLYLFLIYIYDDVCCFSLSSLCVVSFLSLYTRFFMYAILYFCFTLRCLNEFCLKCVRKTGCQNLSCHELSSCKVFQEFVIGLDFIVFNKWLWL